MRLMPTLRPSNPRRLLRLMFFSHSTTMCGAFYKTPTSIGRARKSHPCTAREPLKNQWRHAAHFRKAHDCSKCLKKAQVLDPSDDREWQEMKKPHGKVRLSEESTPASAAGGRTRRHHCSLISTSTPAGRSSFIRASTVLSVGSTMSIRRWWVRISNWSREVLLTWGERRMLKRCRRVGRGTGPLTMGPVRLAVSTISADDWSISL